MIPEAVRICNHAVYNILYLHGRLVEYNTLKDIVDDAFRTWGFELSGPMECAGAYEYVKMLVTESTIEVNLPTIF